MQELGRAFFKAFYGIGLLILMAGPVFAGTLAPRDGWRVLPTHYSFPDLVKRLEDSVKANKMGLVTAASASDGAAGQGIKIPGNRIVGVYRNDFARRMLKASLAAGIEAPIRYYVTENDDGTATLSYKLPSTVFAPYFAEGGGDLHQLASELDSLFAKMADEAVKP